MSLLKPLPGCQPSMWQAVVEWIILLFLWSLYRQFIVTVQCFILLLESPRRYYHPFERFYYCYAIQGRLLPLKEYLNSFFWYFPCFEKQESNQLAPGYRAKLVAYSQPMHKCILLMHFVYSIDLLIYGSWKNSMWERGFFCLFLLQGRVKKWNSSMTVEQCGEICKCSFWNSLQKGGTFSLCSVFLSFNTFYFFCCYPLIFFLTKGYIKSMATKQNR